MFCPKCGTQNNDGAAFCKECGAQFRQAGAQASAQAVPQYQAAGGAVGGAATAVAKRSIGKKPLIIAAIAIVIVAIAVFFFVNSRGCYIITSENIVHSEGGTQQIVYEKANNGMLLELSTSGTSANGTYDSNTISYKELVEGVSIPVECTGTYQMNPDGYVTYYEVLNENGSFNFSNSYTYYKPGIIQSTVFQNSNWTMTSTYSEDGWLTSRIREYKSKSFSDQNTKLYFGYEETNGGKTVLQYAFDDPSHTTGKELSATLELDDNGNIISRQSKSDITGFTSTYSYTYKKILFPAKQVVAGSRLKS